SRINDHHPFTCRPVVSAPVDGEGRADMQDGQVPQAQGLYDPQHEKDACGVGFIVHLKGRKSHDIITKGIEILLNLEHRGACGCEANTGDGAGILIQVPDEFFRTAANLSFELPPAGRYGVGLVFLPRNRDERRQVKEVIARIVDEEGQTLLGWRRVPTDDSLLGERARAVEPDFQHLFIAAGRLPDAPRLTPPASAATGRATRRAKPAATSAAGDAPFDQLAFERKLYVIRKRIEREVAALPIAERGLFYVVSLSSRTLIYKGMLTAAQLAPMF